ncbi:anthranilate synthase family protein [Jiangella asiatica]|uniref:anthranilate synthase n=1 Tax=Jiangella asiatica TaxID=2530372 RepID=A0A4R5DG30_9ACTN|nr:anthranilate synthase family protein [Jiangella asiatica]TDE09635.1 chorismate-binding protein [Jiangella asiatica]
MIHSLLRDPAPPPFAVIARADGPGVEVLLGEVVDVERLADIPLPDDDDDGGPAGPRVLALVPYRQVAERGFDHHDDGAPLRCLVVSERVVLGVDEVLAAIPADGVDVEPGGFDVDDDTYADIVGRVIRDEIGRGEGANFVIRRDYVTRLHGSVPHAALRLFRRLLTGELGAYWTFAVHAGDVTMVGASPERHVSVAGGTAVMNPISGTYRAPADGVTADGLLRFLADPKETEELFMVVDEELKLMAHVCEDGGRVLGPYLKRLRHVVHTEYLLEGTTRMDVRDVLRETMFAPTVTGSPLENAARVITRYEPSGRGYYAGVAALIGRDDDGRRTLDAPILIRTAHLDPDGTVRVPVGATLVRHSVARHEVAETHAKAAGVLAALGLGPSRQAPADAANDLAAHPGVAAALTARNRTLAPFWLRPQGPDERPALAGRTALIVDAEDRWTAMLAHLLRRLGMTAEVRRWDDPAVDGSVARYEDGYDLLVSGPGPGDPRDAGDPRMAHLRGLVTARLATRRPLLAVCLSHQVLADVLGLPVGPLPQPYQGTQRTVDLFGRATSVGFYNTFAATVPLAVPAGLEIAADPVTGEVHALRGDAFASVQFHLESILSTEGVDLLAELVEDVFGTVRTARTAGAGSD